MQSELSGRFEAYVRHFDAAIASVQEALLAQGPRKGTPPRAMVVEPLGAPVDSVFSAMPAPKSRPRTDEQPFSWLHSHGSLASDSATDSRPAYRGFGVFRHARTEKSAKDGKHR